MYYPVVVFLFGYAQRAFVELGQGVCNSFAHCGAGSGGADIGTVFPSLFNDVL
jgi:hypothetical protein